jgi:spermidine synthase
VSGFSETAWPGYAQAYGGDLLHGERSPYQRIEIYENPAFGRMLVLDGLVQTSERDEFMYHEMLVHVPLLTHPEPRRVLVIGGGDGGTLRRVLEHPSVERAVMVEIDERVTILCRELMPGIAGAAFDDPRAEVLVADGAAYVREGGDPFDVIVIDSSDPVGPGEILFTTEFYAQVRARLARGGLMAAQSGSPLFQQREVNRTFASVSEAFPDVRLYLGNVAVYPGSLWSYFVAGERVTIDAAAAEKRAAERGIACRYWSADLHAGAFALPQIVKDVIAPGGPPDPWSA